MGRFVVNVVLLCGFEQYLIKLRDKLTSATEVLTVVLEVLFPSAVSCDDTSLAAFVVATVGHIAHTASEAPGRWPLAPGCVHHACDHM